MSGDIHLHFAIVLFGVLIFAAFARRLSMSVITMPIAFTLFGYAAGQANILPLAMDNERSVLHVFAEATLILLLFADASQVRFARLTKSIAPALRMLLIALPLSIVLGSALAAWVSPEMPYAVALLVAAILTPTDIALGQSLIDNAALPDRLSETMKVESGLNDGLVVPIVTFAAVAASLSAPAAGGESTAAFVQTALVQMTLGPAIGAVIGYGAARLLDFAVARDWSTEAYQGIFFLAAAYLCFLMAEVAGGNGLLAAFVGGLIFGNARKCSSHFVRELMESEGQILTMATFLIFGAAMVPEAIAHATVRTLVLALGFLTLIRMVPVFLSLTGTGLAVREKMLFAWFGPRGLASILFVLLVAEQYDIPGEKEVVACVVLTVLISILLHGASAYPLSRMFAAESKAG